MKADPLHIKESLISGIPFRDWAKVSSPHITSFVPSKIIHLPNVPGTQYRRLMWGSEISSENYLGNLECCSI